MPTPKIPVQRVTVTLTMDCREDLPEPWLEWMRDALEAYGRNVFESGGTTGQDGRPAPPARQKRRHREPPLFFSLNPDTPNA